MSPPFADTGQPPVLTALRVSRRLAPVPAPGLGQPWMSTTCFLFSLWLGWGSGSALLVQRKDMYGCGGFLIGRHRGQGAGQGI